MTPFIRVDSTASVNSLHVPTQKADNFNTTEAGKLRVRILRHYFNAKALFSDFARVRFFFWYFGQFGAKIEIGQKLQKLLLKKIFALPFLMAHSVHRYKSINQSVKAHL